MFTTQTEADSYTLLHNEGLDGLDREYGGATGPLLDRWEAEKLIRIAHTRDGVVVKTFKKYAGVTV